MKKMRSEQPVLYTTIFSNVPLDTGRKLNVRKMFRRPPGHLWNLLCTFNLRPMSRGLLLEIMSHYADRYGNPFC